MTIILGYWADPCTCGKQRWEHKNGVLCSTPSTPSFMEQQKAMLEEINLAKKRKVKMRVGEESSRAERVADEEFEA